MTKPLGSILSHLLLINFVRVKKNAKILDHFSKLVICSCIINEDVRIHCWINKVFNTLNFYSNLKKSTSSNYDATQSGTIRTSNFNFPRIGFIGDKAHCPFYTMAASVSLPKYSTVIKSSLIHNGLCCQTLVLFFLVILLHWLWCSFFVFFIPCSLLGCLLLL